MWLKVPYRQSIINTDNISHFYRRDKEIYASHVGAEWSTLIASYVDEQTAIQAFQGMLDRNFEWVTGDTYKTTGEHGDFLTVKVRHDECKIKRIKNVRRKK
jgi:hypothetical protein